jgi:hypothetical protein
MPRVALGEGREGRYGMGWEGWDGREWEGMGWNGKERLVPEGAKLMIGTANGRGIRSTK